MYLTFSSINSPFIRSFWVSFVLSRRCLNCAFALLLYPKHSWNSLRATPIPFPRCHDLNQRFRNFRQKFRVQRLNPSSSRFSLRIIVLSISLVLPFKKNSNFSSFADNFTVIDSSLKEINEESNGKLNFIKPWQLPRR